MKEMFFSGSDQGAIIGKNAHRMMTNLSIFVDDDIQQTLSFFAKVYFFPLLFANICLEACMHFTFI